MYTRSGWVPSLISVCLLTGCFAVGESSHTLQSRIPNGERVPDPCSPDQLWAGVTGHNGVQGENERDPFERDFRLNGMKWDYNLCMADSDRDGKTNGEELGDPSCIWTPGRVPERKIDISHPGICEPIDAPHCEKLNAPLGDLCAAETFECEYANTTDVELYELRINESPVPAKKTTYMCQSFVLPMQETERHLIASEPIIDNANVVHHMVLFGCPDVVDDDYRDEPKECGMAVKGCNVFIGIWAVGIKGVCFKEEIGFPLGGANHIRRIIVQTHWNNPSLKSGQTDSSGMKIYLTPNLRKYELGVWPIGPYNLYIPPGEEAYPVSGTCSSACTSAYTTPLLLISVHVHMHSTGRAATVVIVRDGRETMIIETNDVHYDNPPITRFDPPVQVRPGDEVKVTCIFNTTDREGITLFGDGSHDEMCMMFVSYYTEKPSWRPTDCLTYKDIDVCERVPTPEILEGCRDSREIGAFLADPAASAAIRQVESGCDTTGVTCLPGCQEAIRQVTALNHSCTRSADTLGWMLTVATMAFDKRNLNYAMHSCDTS